MATPVKGRPGKYRRGNLLPGVADVCGVTSAGRFIAVEVKVGKDKLRPAQMDFAAEVVKRGGLHVVCRDTVDALLKVRERIACGGRKEAGGCAEAGMR
jgi:hypothetical protein